MGNSVLEYPCLNIIHDNRLFNRLEPLVEEMHRQGINYKIWDAVECKDSVIKSINLSHKQIVQYAKDNGLKEIAIGEDDLFFPAPNGWQFFLRNKPEKYDLYLGCTFMPLHAKSVCGFHLYCIHEQYYDKFLSIPDNVHIDTAQDELKGHFEFCYPYPALQRPMWSANNRAEVNYNAVLNKEDIYQ